MLDVKADGQHARKPIFNLFLQGFIMIRIVAVAEHSGHFQLLMVPSHDIINIVGPSLILDDVDSAESNHATEESGILLRLNIILLNDKSLSPSKARVPAVAFSKMAMLSSSASCWRLRLI